MNFLKAPPLMEYKVISWSVSGYNFLDKLFKGHFLNEY